jgi:hypothetical protein
LHFDLTISALQFVTLATLILTQIVQVLKGGKKLNEIQAAVDGRLDAALREIVDLKRLLWKMKKQLPGDEDEDS